MHNFLKRGKGKVTSSIKKSNLYKYYLQNSKEEKVEVKVYNRFVKELLQTYSTEIVTTGYWHTKYPGLTKDEIINVPDKKVLYHENEHSNAEFYEHFWDNYSAVLKYKSFYIFKASRQYSRLIAQVVKDPNRKTFYYG